MVEPAGVVVGIVPWNAPLILEARAMMVALAVGNTVVLRPSEDAPITSGLFLADVLAEAGLPAGVLNVVTNDREDAPAIIEALIADPRVRRVTFTGSTGVGRIIGELTGKYLKPAILELGGKNPIIVLADADVDHAVREIVYGRYNNSGQICLSVDRIILHHDIAEEFTEKFVKAAAVAPAGDPDAPDTLVGGLINPRSAERVAGLVADAVSKGARVLLGGGPADGNRYPATVIDGLTLRCGSTTRRPSARSPRSTPSTPTRPRSRSRTTPNTAWPAACSPATRSRPCPSRGGCGTAPPTSTHTR